MLHSYAQWQSFLPPFFSPFFLFLFFLSLFSCLFFHFSGSISMYILSYGFTQNSKLQCKRTPQSYEKKEDPQQVKTNHVSNCISTGNSPPRYAVRKVKKNPGQMKFIILHISQGKKEGVSISVHKSINSTATTTHKDTEGRYILGNWITDGTNISLIMFMPQMKTVQSL